MKLTETIKLPIWRKINKFSLCTENNMYINKVTSWKNLYMPCQSLAINVGFPVRPICWTSCLLHGNPPVHVNTQRSHGHEELSSHVCQLTFFLHNQVSTPQQVWIATVPFSKLPLIPFLQETSNNNRHTTVPHVPSWNPPSPSWQGETLTHKHSANICLWACELTEGTCQKCMALHPPH